MKGRILIVEDDDNMARVLADTLRSEGYEVERTRDVPETLSRLQGAAPDLVLLDLTLPGGDGLEICETLARGATRVPVIIVSARGQNADKVRGLKSGADDYIAKPFDSHELLARVEAVLRRRPPGLKKLTLGETEIDFVRKAAVRAGRPLALSHRELQLLQYLADRAYQVVGRDELLREVWSYRVAPLTRAVDIAVRRLREKIEPEPQHPRYIRTMHGDGYCLTPEG